MSEIHFESTYDDSKLISGLNRSEKSVENWARNATKSGESVEQMFNRIQTAAAAYLSLDFAGNIGKEIVNVRGEFQQLGIAFETMLGSKEKADKLMREQIIFAAKTPFTLQDVATNTKQLMAMGVGYKDVMATMKALGDVAAGVSVPISRVAINYGQVMTLGKLQEREVRDFAMAGIPLLDELAKNMGKTKAEITDMISASQITSAEVTKAFQTMSGEGGKFYNLMEKQNASVTGQISNLKDKMQVAANEIGQENEGLIYGAVSMATNAVSHYKEIGEVIMGLATTYGVYKAAVITVSAVQETEAEVLAAKKTALLEANALQDKQAAEALRLAQIEAAAAQEQIAIESTKQAATARTTAAKQAAAKANEELIAAEKSYAITSAEASAAYGVGAATEKQLLLKKELQEVEKARIAANKANLAAEKAMTAERVLNENIEANAVKKAEAEKIAATEAGIIAEREQAVAATVATGAEVRAAQAKKLSAAAQQLLNATMLNNPYVLAAAAIGAVAYGMYKLISYQSELEKAMGKLNVEFENQRDKANSLFSELKLTASGTKEHEDAKRKLIDAYGQYIPEQNKELKNLQDIKIAQDEVNKSLKENLALKTRDELKSNISNEFNPQILKYKERILGSLSGEQKSDASFLLDQFIQQAKTEGLTIDQALIKRDEILKKLNLLSSDGKFIGAGDKVTTFFRYMTESIVEMNDATKEVDDSFNKFISDSGKNADDGPKNTVKTIKEQIEELSKSLSEAESKLKEMRNTDSTSTYTEIDTQEKLIKDLKDKIELLTGIKKKEVQKQLKTEQEKLEALRDLALQELKITQNTEEAKTAAINEGTAKQRKAIQDSYKSQLLEIDKQKKEYLDKLNKSKDLKITDKGYITVLPADIQDKFDQQTISARQVRDNELLRLDEELIKQQKIIWDAATEAFISNTEKEKRAINKKYDDLISQQRLISKQKDVNYVDADGNMQTTSVTDTTEIDNLNKQRAKELANVNKDAALKISSYYQKAFGDIEHYGYAALKKLNDQTQVVIKSAKQVNEDGKTFMIVDIPSIDAQGKEVRKQVKLTVDEFTTLKNKANEIRNLLRKENPFGALKEDFKDVLKAIKSGNKEDLSSAVSGFNESLSNAISMVNDMGESLGKVFGEQTTKDIKSVTEIVGGLTNIGSGAANLATGNYITGSIQIVKGLADAGSAIASLLHKQKEIAASFENINENIQKVINSVTVAAQSLENLNQDSTTRSLKVLKSQLLDLADSAKLLNTELEKSSTGRRRDVNLTLPTNIIKQAIDLETEIEKLTNRLLQGDISDDQRKAIEALLESYNSLLSQIDATIQNLIGTTVSDFGTSLSDAIIDGAGSWDIWEQKATDVIKRVTSKQLQSKFIEQPVTEAINALVNDSTNGLTADEASKFKDAIKSIYTEVGPAYQAAIDALKTVGIDITSASSSSSTALTGITASLTEETGSLIAGIGTAVRIDIKTLVDMNQAQIDGMNISIGHLAAIEKNTNELYRLSKLEEYAKETNRILNEKL